MDFLFLLPLFMLVVADLTHGYSLNLRASPNVYLGSKHVTARAVIPDLSKEHKFTTVPDYSR